MVFGRTVTDVQRIGAGENRIGSFRVVSKVGDETLYNDYDAVVNCLWEGRAAIDRKMGLTNRADNESYRLKASIRLPNLPAHSNIPSVSIMNGPFGDFVRYGPDDQVYFAWHPASPEIITHNESAIKIFEPHANYVFPQSFKKNVIGEHKRAFSMIFPDVDTSFFDSALLGAGYVVANGATDIGDPDSGFHERRDPPNLVSDGYVSVKTQKLTNAPYNVYLLEQELFLRDDLVIGKNNTASYLGTLEG
jgi:hypothetical protein